MDEILRQNIESSDTSEETGNTSTAGDKTNTSVDTADLQVMVTEMVKKALASLPQPAASSQITETTDEANVHEESDIAAGDDSWFQFDEEQLGEPIHENLAKFISIRLASPMPREKLSDKFSSYKSPSNCPLKETKVNEPIWSQLKKATRARDFK